MTNDEERLKRHASDLIRKMQTYVEKPICHGKLWTEDPRVAKTIYIAAETETDISMYLEPPPFSNLKWAGYFGRAWHMRRTIRGLFHSTFTLWCEEDNGEEVQYTTDNQFEDLLNKFIAA
jgi:hypothetical protein